MISKKIIIPIVALGAVGVITLTASQINAQTKSNGFSNLAQAIAEKFNLNENDVQSFLTQFRQTNRQNTLKTRLDSLVSSGKITTGQETAIINELEFLKTKYMANPGKQNFKDMATEFNTWLKSQNIDPSLIPMFKLRMGMHKMMGNK